MSDKTVSVWTQFLTAEIDTNISEIRRRNSSLIEMLENRVVDEIVNEAGIVSEWNELQRVEKEYAEIKSAYRSMEIKFNNMRNRIGNELNLDMWGVSVDTPISKVVSRRYSKRVDRLFLGTPDGEPIAELMAIRSKIDHKLHIADASKRLMDAVQQICDAAGIDTDGLEV